MRAITRLEKVSINTVRNLLIDAGEACADYHDRIVRHIYSPLVQVDELWTFTYAKEKNVDRAQAAPDHAGDTWTWTAIDRTSRLLISWHVGRRDQGSAYTFMFDLADRIESRPQIVSDGFKAYPEAVREAFRSHVDFAQMVKQYGTTDDDKRLRYIGSERKSVIGRVAKRDIGTSHVERQNLTMRMSMRRFTRRTNAFSKLVSQHINQVSLYSVYYNFCRVHGSLEGATPAIEAGLSEKIRDCEWIVSLIEVQEAAV